MIVFFYYYLYVPLGEEELETEDCTPKKRKVENRTSGSIKINKTPVQSVIDAMNKNSENRESARAKRYQELLEVRREAVSVFSTKMDSLLLAIQAKNTEN